MSGWAVLNSTVAEDGNTLRYDTSKGAAFRDRDTSMKAGRYVMYFDTAMNRKVDFLAEIDGAWCRIAGHTMFKHRDQLIPVTEPGKFR